MRKVEVVPYDSGWPDVFEKTAAALRELLGSHCLDVHHIGSTAVPGLAAKPVIDMLAVVGDIKAVDRFDSRFLQLGYIPKGENGLAGRRYFEKGGDQRTHHIHCYQQGHPDIIRHLAFRNFVRSHPQKAEAYGELKLNLAKRHPWDIERYIEGKQKLVQVIEQQAIGEI